MTIATPQDLRALTHELTTSVWTLSVIGVLLESGLVEHLRESRSLDDLSALCSTLSKSRIERCLALAATAGVVIKDDATHRYRLAEGAMPFSQQPLRATLAGDLRSMLMQSLALLDSSSSAEGGKATTGWRHTSPVLLQAQGNASMVFPQMLKATLMATLGDLASRFDNGAGGSQQKQAPRFLDIGVGVAALSIAMCRVWPELQAVGLDVFDVPLAIAAENVSRAGLSERIELRKLAVQDLRDESSFDLAWLPSVFIPEAILPAALSRVHASLRPGGFLLLPVMGLTQAPPRSTALSALLNDLWGGPILTPADGEALVTRAGFSKVRTVAGPSPTAPPLIIGER